VTEQQPTIGLRPATNDDTAFFARVYASTRAEELAPVPWTDEQKRTFLAQQFAAQTAHYAQHYADAAFDVVLIDGEPAGRLIVWRGDGQISIVDIALLPEFRGGGVGTRLLRPLLDESDAGGAKVVIYVERDNPALRLYERLGFVPAGETGVYLRMERSPADAQANTDS
jgi:ribosomal protein S18 acetylase RimI-like enzyme